MIDLIPTAAEAATAIWGALVIALMLYITLGGSE